MAEQTQAAQAQAAQGTTDVDEDLELDPEQADQVTGGTEAWPATCEPPKRSAKGHRR